MATTVPEGYADLLDRPVVGVLSTVGPDGIPNATPMWFAWDGEHLRFTHTKARKKIRNLEGNPNYSFVITDPDNPYRYLELRGQLESVTDDPTGAFYVTLGKRYGNADQQPPPDAADRVILTLTASYFGKK
ncbi:MULTISPECIES: PPOX class F420-dependent oxidoreductase [unclassified Gordonia (in: high G+C Gram-positive bacteria)]|uniref:PPOX class F420-dependent oxidoreductase n=1 Tax=unclassified Gordonia (in: high G+C Gram-positive bacteria) TaxID=2657482 RepID=UPI001F0D8D38|nr:PPOX class F420-dependent oxidoreductase [Gordonia sp. ABSL49_1]MCH5642983.1 PPOX class F420-dependent oxidoreductase [Gordonia sp. ABSL49_1]